MSKNLTPSRARHRGWLSVRGLTIDLDRGGAASVRLLEDVSLEVHSGETVGVVGESGSGKTLTARAIMGLLPAGLHITSGTVTLDGLDLASLSRNELDRVRGRRIAMVFQDATRSLNPTLTIGEQISEVARSHLGMSRADAKRRAIEMLEAVEIARPAQRCDEYPHSLSGGMCQRVMIAMALVCRPEFLIADEPTTALDVTVQAQILRLIRNLQIEFGLGVLFVSHDLGLVAEISDRVVVMYAGETVETGPLDSLFRRPLHPYTEGLLQSRPERRSGGLFAFIPGTVPSPKAWPSGCRFHPRCAYCDELRCSSEPITPTEHDSGSVVRCIRSSELHLRGVG